LQKNEQLEQLTDKCHWLLKRNETLDREKQMLLEQMNRDSLQQQAKQQQQQQQQHNIAATAAARRKPNRGR
jgi:hypothetical protein